jgi:putative oxidoreductase
MGALLILMVRWIIAGIFLRAGVVKLGDRAGFRAGVANYHLLPPALVAPVAAVLPVAEIAGAVLLAAGILTAPVAIGLGLLLAAFASAIALALAHGRSFDCGCSGTATPSRIGWRHVALDLVLAAGAALVAGYGPVALSVWPGPLSGDPWKAPAGGITPTVIAVLVVLMATLVTRQAAFVRGLMTSATDTARQPGIPGR